MRPALAQTSRDEIDALKARFDIVAEAQRVVPSLRRHGREYLGLSPFKAERTPSFTVDPQKQVYSGHFGRQICDLLTQIDNRILLLGNNHAQFPDLIL